GAQTGSGHIRSNRTALRPGGAFPGTVPPVPSEGQRGRRRRSKQLVERRASRHVCKPTWHPSRSWDRTIHDQAKPHTSPRSSMYARDSNGTDGGCSRIVWTTQKSVTRRTVLQSPG